MKKIIAIAQKFSASLTLFYVITDETDMDYYEKFKSNEYRESLITHFKFDKIILQTIQGKEKSLIDSIRSFVKDNDPDMLIMLTHKRGFFNKFYDPSQTKEISYQMTVPLMVLKQ